MSSLPQRAIRRAFTLVELLVVITIIGILVALLLPAVQSSRESARFALCQTNVRSLAQGSVASLQQTGHLPAGGWGWRWIGDPDKGNDWKQPGSWIYNLLPYIDAGNLHDLGSTNGNKQTGLTTMLQTPLNVLQCPTRRPVKLYKTWQKNGGGQMYDGGSCSVGDVVRSDYAANGGDTYNSPSTGGWSDEGGPGDYPSGITTAGKAKWDAIVNASNGVVCSSSLTNDAAITDGMSKTMLIGEKYMNPDWYDPQTYDLDGSKTDMGDNENAYMGNNADLERWGGPGFQPMQDTFGLGNTYIWGSAHPSSFNMSFCDGSVHAIQYTIDLEVFRRLSNRADNQPISAGTY